MATPLPRRPSAIAISVEDLVEQVRRGEVRVPPFQRDFRWGPSDIRLLFDSIYQGFPVGTLLFWKREAPAARVTLGPVSIDAPSRSDAWWVVDGQQRITSLVGALLHPSPLGGGDAFALGFDLEEGHFERPPRHPRASWLPLNVVLDTTKLLEWLDSYPERQARPDHVAKAHQLAKAVREYQLPGYIIETGDEEAVREVFGRLNQAGKRLKEDEVFHSLHGGVSSGQPSDLAALGESLTSLHFGRLDRSVLVKAVLAVAGLDITQARSRDLDRKQIPKILQRTEQALKDTIVFLKRDAGIPHALLLPYTLPVAVLARFFSRIPSPSARSRDLLSRWVWRGAITAHHRGESIPEVRQVFAAVGDEEDASVQALLRTLPPPSKPSSLDTLREFNLKNARTKLEANALLALHPRHLLTNEPIDVVGTLEAEGGGAFRRLVPTFPAKGLTQRKLRGTPLNTLANRVFHPELVAPDGSPMPGGMAGLAGMFAVSLKLSHSELVFSSHALSSLHFTPIASGDVKAFMELVATRAKWLQRHTGLFLMSKAKWAESDRPSISSLIVPDSEGTGGE